MTDVDFILAELNKLAEPVYLQKMTNFGIDNSKAIGVRIPNVRILAKEIGKNQDLSLSLWETDIHEARILAGIIGDYKQVTETQINKWVADFNSWDICDQACANLFVKTPFVNQKIIEFSRAESEFVKRTSFTLMATAAVHLKKQTDNVFESYLPIIESEAYDSRNFVKKANNWALRQIGKRNANLHALALQTAHNILNQNNKKANWIALSAIKELESPAVLKKLKIESQN